MIRKFKDFLGFYLNQPAFVGLMVFLVFVAAISVLITHTWTVAFWCGVIGLVYWGIAWIFRNNP